MIRGYDAITGKMAWAWDLGNPQNVHGPAEGSTYTRGTPNMWTAAVGDEQLGYVYLPISNSSIDYYGSNRSEAENKYSTSLVAVDVKTGKDVWHFQTIRHDVWDYDLGSQPTLLDFPGKDGNQWLQCCCQRSRETSTSWIAQLASLWFRLVKSKRQKAAPLNPNS